MPQPVLQPNACFVYGTLMRGRCRERCWPAAPTRVVPASVAGALYGLGSYPGLVAGDDRIAGECWWFADRELPRVFAAIDEVEGYRRRPDDEYRRERSTCRLSNGFTQQVWLYRYARPLSGHQPLPPDPDGLVRWRPQGELRSRV